MPDTLNTRLEELASVGSLADGTPCRTISVSQLAHLAEEANLPGWTVEIAALEKKIVPDRYMRNYHSLNTKDQIRLLKSKACIVGLGGLGGLVTETLARMGIGRLKLIDGDTFEAHNLNRQLLSSIDGLGTSKADAAARRVEAINPGIEVSAKPVYLTTQNARNLVESCHIVVDCLDNIRSRFILESAAKQAGIPMVSAAVAGMSGHVTTIFPEDRGLENIYGPRDQLTTVKGAETHLGCLAPGVNLIASSECAEVLNVLLAKGNTLQNRLLVVDLTDYTFETLQFS